MSNTDPIITSVGFPGIEVDEAKISDKVAGEEQTDPQSNYMLAWAGSALYPYATFNQNPCPPGVLSTYRWMEHHPTLALAKGVITVPVVGAPFAVEAENDSVPDEWVKLIQKTFIPQLPELLYNAIDALSYRWQPFEVCWGFDEDGYHVPQKFKPLLQEITYPLVSKKLKQFVGLRNLNTDIFGPNAFVFAENPQYGTSLGKSRHENARQHAWWPWMTAQKRSDQLDRKATGIVFAVKGPTHQQFKQADGTYVTGQAASLNLANMLQQGISVYMPNRIVTAKSVDQMKELAKVSDFDVNYYDLGDTGSASEAVLNKMRYYDSCMFRAWKRPERSALEGQKGTLAEAEAHGDIGMGDSELLRTFIARAINRGPVDETLEENFGAKARGKVRLKPSPVTEGRFVVLKMMLDRLMQYPAAMTAMIQQTDMDSVFDVLGVPKRQSLVKMDNVDVTPPKPEPTDPNGKAAQKGQDNQTK